MYRRYRAIICKEDVRSVLSYGDSGCGGFGCKMPLLHTILADMYEGGKPPMMVCCTAEEYEATVGSHALRYSSPGVPRNERKMRIEFQGSIVRFSANGLGGYVAGMRPNTLIVSYPFCSAQLMCAEIQSREKGGLRG